jgi:hypothetical protein
LPLQVDLQDVLVEKNKMIPGIYTSPEEQRVYGRINHDPLMLAADAANLPVKSDSMKYAWGLFSVPFYQTDAAAVRASLSEVNRVLEPGAYARFFPLRESQIDIVKKWAQTQGIKPSIEHTGHYGFGLYNRPKGYLLTWQKPG